MTNTPETPETPDNPSDATAEAQATPEIKPYVDPSFTADDQDRAAEAPSAEEFAAMKDQLMRYAAEVENTRKRAEREVAEARNFAINRFARDLLGVADNLQRALQSKPEAEADSPVAAFITGVEMTEKELMACFERNGLKPVAPEAGEPLNPHLHQAMAEAPAPGQKAGSIVQVMQTGYELMGRILRPAMVIVAARGQDKTSEAQKEATETAPGSTIDQKM